MKRIVLAVCAAVLVFSCDDKSNPAGAGGGGGGTPPAGTIKLMSGSIAVSGSTMTTILTSTSCESDELVTSSDTSVQTFTVSATTLTIDEGSDAQTLTRVGTGTGLDGTWSMTDEEMGQAYVVVNGSIIEMWFPVSFIMDQIKFEFIPEFENPGFTIDTSNATAAKLTGKTTNEVVTISVNSQGQIVWSSSKAGNTPLTVSLINPTSCDAPLAPAWLTTFIMENTVAAKTLANSASLKNIAAVVISKLKF